MTIRHYGRALPKQASMIWLTALVIAIPACFIVAVVFPQATADGIAVMVGVPIAIFFLYGQLAIWITGLIPPPAKGEATAKPTRAMRLVALAALAIFLAFPSAIVYHSLGLERAARGAVVAIVCAVAVIVSTAIMRWLMGGARSLSRVAAIPVTMLATSATTFVAVANAVSSATSRVTTTLHHRIA